MPEVQSKSSTQHETSRRHAVMAVTVGTAPLLLVHLCHAISWQAGRLPLCVTYLSGLEDILGLHNNAIDIIEWNFLALMSLWYVAAGRTLFAQEAIRWLR